MRVLRLLGWLLGAIPIISCFTDSAAFFRFGIISAISMVLSDFIVLDLGLRGRDHGSFGFLIAVLGALALQRLFFACLLGLDGLRI